MKAEREQFARDRARFIFRELGTEMRDNPESPGLSQEGARLFAVAFVLGCLQESPEFESPEGIGDFRSVNSIILEEEEALHDELYR